MFKVGIIGPEASGKSTLARYLAKRYKGTLVSEYAREYVEQKGTTDVSYNELCEIAKHQIEQIRSVSPKGGLSEKQSVSETVYQPEAVFYDTELIVTKVWFDYAFGSVPEWLNEAIQTYPMDVYLLTCPDLPWAQDGARYNGSDAMRRELFDRYEQEIQALDIPYYIIRHTD
ncbi:MAG: ATP-binding protein [Paludibacteraceae bacterium]|nr:ATP-binding protein [Paludibacteraceae bacterium]